MKTDDNQIPLPLFPPPLNSPGSLARPRWVWGPQCPSGWGCPGATLGPSCTVWGETGKFCRPWGGLCSVGGGRGDRGGRDGGCFTHRVPGRGPPPAGFTHLHLHLHLPACKGSGHGGGGGLDAGGSPPPAAPPGVPAAPRPGGPASSPRGPAQPLRPRGRGPQRPGVPSPLRSRSAVLGAARPRGAARAPAWPRPAARAPPPLPLSPRRGRARRAPPLARASRARRRAGPFCLPLTFRWFAVSRRRRSSEVGPRRSHPPPSSPPRPAPLRSAPRRWGGR